MTRPESKILNDNHDNDNGDNLLYYPRKKSNGFQHTNNLENIW